MSPWATCFDPRPFRRSGRILVALLCLAAAGIAGRRPAEARVFAQFEEALARLVPGADVRRSEVFLSAAQEEQIQKLAGVPVESSVIFPYRLYLDGAWTATAYLDSHRVRTLPETLLIVVNRDGSIRNLQVLAFQEPEEYLAPPRWYETFISRSLNRELQLKQEIDALSGATLTARATVNAARRVLAIDEVLRESPEP